MTLRLSENYHFELTAFKDWLNEIVKNGLKRALFLKIVFVGKNKSLQYCRA